MHSEEPLILSWFRSMAYPLSCDPAPKGPLWFDNTPVSATIQAIQHTWPDRTITFHDVLWFLPLERLIQLQKIAPQCNELNAYLSSLPGIKRRTRKGIWFFIAERRHARNLGYGLLFTISNGLNHIYGEPVNPYVLAEDVAVYFPDQQNPYDPTWWGTSETA